jgi:hypothetical protein
MQIVNSRIVLLWMLLLATEVGAHATLVYPRGGEVLQPGSRVTIQWRMDVAHDDQENWDLYLSTDGGVTWEALALDLPVAQLRHMWTVPEAETASARIKVVQDNTITVDYEDSSDDFTIAAVATALEPPHPLPETPALLVAYPNPFTTATVFELSLARTGHASLVVFDVRGVRVATLVDRVLPAGKHHVAWRPPEWASGVYLGRVEVDGEVVTRTVLRVR